MRVNVTVHGTLFPAGSKHSSPYRLWLAPYPHRHGTLGLSTIRYRERNFSSSKLHDLTRRERALSGPQVRLRNTGLLNATAGAFAVAGSLIFYSAYTSSFSVLTAQILGMFRWLSYLTILIILVGVFAALLGIKQFLAAKKMLVQSSGSPPVSAILANVLGARKYSRVLLFAALAYGLFYAAVSSIIVYRPEQNFAIDYLAEIPSVVVTVCCGGVGFVPVFTVYLTEHLGLLIIPASIILMILVSGLVGVNVALAVYEYDNRPRGAGPRWFGGFGAVTGLFTACPTCAGLFLGNLIQGMGTAAVAAVLAGNQPIFLAMTFPLLVLSTYLMGRRLRQALCGSCAVVQSN